MTELPPPNSPLAPTSAPTRADAAALLIDDRAFDKHAPKGHHPERPARLEAARAALQELAEGGEAPRFEAVPLREATADELARVHHASFVEQLEALRGRAGYLDPDTYLAEESVAVARAGAGAAVDLIEGLLQGRAKKGLALVRPPGHHATPDRAMGFCLLNGVAVAAAHARARGVERVLVLDWDVHHGNGTQDAFYGDPGVLFVSLHQWPFYPGSGNANETGAGDGVGYTVNLPLSAHATDGLYRGAFERVVLPVVDAYKPELVLVSAGFDASERDPLAQMDLTEAAFGWMAAALRDVAERHAGGRMALFLEGGYDLGALEDGFREAARAMLAPPGTPYDGVVPVVDHGDFRRIVKHTGKSWKGVT